MNERNQRQFHELVNCLMNEPKFETYHSVISMIYTLIEDGKIEELNTVLHFHFPQYYRNPVPLIQSDN